MTFLGLNSDQWQQIALSLGIVVAAILLGRWIIGFLLNRVLARLVRRTRTELDNLIIDTVRPTLYLLLIVIAIQSGFARLPFLLSAEQLNDYLFVLYFLTGFAFVWILAMRVFEWYGAEVAPKTESELDEQLIPFFSRVARIILTILGAIILLDKYGVDVSGLVTTLGIGSLAIALAAQEALADTIAGFVIMIDRPFRIGDRIEIQDLDTWGDVVDIGLRSSRVRTRDNRMVIVPNSVIGKSLVVNYSYPDTLYRIQIHIGVGYGTDLEEARDTMVEAVRKVEGVSSAHPVEALFLEFGDSALIFRVRWWLDSYYDTRRMFDAVNTAIYNALTSKKIDIPYPQRDLHHKIDVESAGRLSGMIRPG